MRGIKVEFLILGRLHTAVLQNLAKNSNVNFSACVKFHVENEWEISRMCEIDV